MAYLYQELIAIQIIPGTFKTNSKKKPPPKVQFEYHTTVSGFINILASVSSIKKFRVSNRESSKYQF